MSLKLMSAVILSSESSQNRAENPDKLLKQLLECVQQCQKRYGGKNELATEFDSCVAGLCLCLEAVFLHGLRSKPYSGENQSSALKQVSNIVVQSLHIGQESVSFWPFIQRHLTKHEQERYAVLKHIWTDIGKCKAWIRVALNEKSLERYFHTVLGDRDILRENYESWALLRDEDKNSMLPNMAAGLGSILFAISIDKPEFNSSIIPRPGSIGPKEEPIIEVPMPDNQDKKKDNKKKRKVARQIISFDDDDSMLSTSVPSISSSSTCSDSSSSTGNQQRGNLSSTIDVMENSEESKGNRQNYRSGHIDDNKYADTSQSRDRDKPKFTRNLSIENSGSREKFSTNVPETLTPVNQNSIGELTPVSVERIKDFEESPDISDDILEVPTDISAVLTVVENKNQEEIRRRDERIRVISRENESLKEQVKKYVSAIKMLRRDEDGLQKALDGLQIEPQPDYKVEAKIYEQKLVQRIRVISRENESLKEQVNKYVSAIKMLRRDEDGLQKALDGLQIEPQPDYKVEAKIYEQKLVQVAEMHAELMDFNVTLQQSLCQKDALLERLKSELEELRGPMSTDELSSDESRGSVNVWIPSAFLTGTGSNSHHVYQIFLKAGNDEWNIYRRYAQFHALHTDLKKLDPTVGTFDFPPKKTIGKKDSGLVEERRKRLQIYLRKVIAHWPELAHCSSRFLLEQHLAFFKDQRDDETKKNMFTSRRSGNSSNYSGL